LVMINFRFNFLGNKQMYCLLLCIFSFVEAKGQINLKGKVTDSLTRKSVSNAIVQYLDADSLEVLSYSFCNSDGEFQLDIPQIMYPILIKVSRLGYVSKLYVFKKEDKIDANLTFELKEYNIIISEFLVSGRAKIKEKSDTTTFDVKQYRDSTERNLEQLLSKIPGVDVNEKEGTITFKGKLIKRILIDGDDLSGSNYSIVTRSIDPALLETIQVIDKFEANDFLKNAFTSDDQVINLTLKREYKISNSGQVGIGIGYGNSAYHNHDAKLLSFTQNVKLLSNLQYNTVGLNSNYLLRNNLNSLPRTASFNINPILLKNPIKGFVEDFSAQKLPISSELYNFNQTNFGTINFSIKKTPNLKSNGFISFAKENNRTFKNADYSYKLLDSLFLIKEFDNNRNEKLLLVSALNLEYSRKKSQFSYQGYYDNGKDDNANDILFNNATVNANHTYDNSKVKNEVNFIHKFTGKITFIGSFLNIYQKRNELLSTNEAGNFRFWDFSHKPISRLFQKSNFDKNDNQLSTSLYFGKDSSKFSISLGAATNEQFGMSSLGFYDTSKVFNQISNASVNNFVLSTKEYFSQIKWQKKLENTNFYFSMRYGYLQSGKNANRYAKDYLLPEFGIIKKYKNNQFTATFKSDLVLPNFNDLFVSTQFITSYRTTQTGFAEQNPLQSNKLTFSFIKTNLKKGFNAYFNVVVNSFRGGYKQTTEIKNDFILSSAAVNNQPNINMFANGGVDKFIEKFSLRFFLKPFAAYSTSQNTLVGYGDNSIKSFYYGSDIQIKSGFIGFFNFNMRFNQSWNKIMFDNDIQKTNFMVSTKSLFTSIYFNVGKYSRFEIENEGVSVSSENKKDVSNFWYSNVNYFFNPQNDKWDMSIKLNNLFNTQEWTNAQVNDLAFNTTSIKLIPRYVLLKFTYKFK
jgi:hypothetical protein